MQSNPNPGWNWQTGMPEPPRPKRSRRRTEHFEQRGPSPRHFWPPWRSKREPDNEPSDPKQPFGAMEFPPEPDLGRDAGRLRLLKWTVPVVVIVALIGLWLTFLFLWTMFARTQFEGDNLASALNQYERQETVTRHFPQPWLSQYNLGTALLMNGDLDAGVAELAGAMEGVPKAVRGEAGNIQPFSYECMVRMNLGAGIEMQGDALAADSGGEEIVDAARMHYEEALEIVAPCEVPPQPQSDESTGEEGGEGTPEEQNEAASEEFQQDGNEAGDRLREKLGQEPQKEEQDQQDQDQLEQEQESDSTESTDPFEGETQEERERREELEERNREHAERQREDEESWNRQPGSGGW